MRPEEKVEKEFVEECKRIYGIDAYKFEIRNKKGAPDRIMFLPQATTILIEFKKPGLREDGLSKHQIEFIDDLTQKGFSVLVTDCVCEALNFVKSHLENTK